MAKHRNNPNMAFWKMIKEGYDHFEVTRQEPKVDFCEKKYVFDAAKAPDAKRDPVFDASAKCPAYVIPEDIASAVREKEQRDEAEYNKLVSKGTPVARMNTGIDGGMNKIFAAKIPEGSTGLSEGAEGNTLQMLAMSKAPGTIPGTVNPPKPNLEAVAAAPQEEPVVAVAAPATNTRVAIGRREVRRLLLQSRPQDGPGHRRHDGDRTQRRKQPHRSLRRPQRRARPPS